MLKLAMTAHYFEKPQIIEIADLPRFDPFYCVDFGRRIYYTDNENLMCEFCHKRSGYFLYKKTDKGSILYCLKGSCMDLAKQWEKKVSGKEYGHMGIKILPIN